MQQERYLWVHFVGLAAVPLLLDLCLAGLASASPAFNYPEAFGLQYWAIALFGIAPTLWMQIARPFYPFGLPPLALKPSALSEDQRRCLQALTSWQIKALAGITTIGCLWLLAQLYARSPQITPLFTPIAGLITAAISFFFVCLFLQISVSMARTILIGPQTLKRVTPYEESAIAANFLILGLPVEKILPAPSEQASPPTAPKPDRRRPATKKSAPVSPAEPSPAEPPPAAAPSQASTLKSSPVETLSEDAAPPDPNLQQTAQATPETADSSNTAAEQATLETNTLEEKSAGKINLEQPETKEQELTEKAEQADKPAQPSTPPTPAAEKTSQANSEASNKINKSSTQPLETDTE